MRSEYLERGGDFRESQKRFLEAIESRLPLWQQLISASDITPEARKIFNNAIEKRVSAARLPAERYGKPGNYREDFSYGLLSDLLTTKGEAIAAGAPVDEVVALTASLKGDIHNFLSKS